MKTTTWTVWSPENKPVAECATEAEARDLCKLFGGSIGGYWVSQN